MDFVPSVGIASRRMMNCLRRVFSRGYTMMDLSWMAWTLPTALFFACIAVALVGMTLWEKRHPGGNPRIGILGLHTTRGDRLFISLLGSAIIHLAWLAIFGPPLAGAMAVSILFAAGVFWRV